jgi:hypothetical protein
MVTEENGTCWTCFDIEASGIVLPPIETGLSVCVS